MMASGKTAKKNRSKAPVIRHRKGPPWLTIGAVTVIVALAAGIFWVVFNQSRANQALAVWEPSVENPDPSVDIPEIFIGASVTDETTGRLEFADYANAIHVGADQRVDYDVYPPIGGPHDGTWAACNGVVYDVPVRDENMVHTLEHGAVWIAYNPELIADGDLDILTDLVRNSPYASLTPYPTLDRPISLQAWAHQLKVDSASDERVRQFVTALMRNAYVYPEIGATCQQPSFDLENPPPFDGSPRGEDAIPMTGEGGVEATDEMPVDEPDDVSEESDEPQEEPSDEQASDAPETSAGSTG